MGSPVSISSFSYLLVFNLRCDDLVHLILASDHQGWPVIIVTEHHQAAFSWPPKFPAATHAMHGPGL